MTIDAPVRSVIAARAATLWPELVTLRRRIHHYPELAGAEVVTAQLVANRLAEAGLEVRRSVGGHGVVGLLRGLAEEPVVAYRADMDAVAAHEAFDGAYASAVEGVAHICGHDVHTAVGVGVAEILSSLRATLPGSALFIFQPAEEPLEGAQAMIDDGALSDPAPSAYFAVHAFPLPAGSIAVTPGSGFASRDHLELQLPATISPRVVEAIESCLFGIGRFTYPNTPTGFDALLHELRVGGRFERFFHVERWPDDRKPDTLTLNFGLRAAGYSAEELRRRVTRALAPLKPSPIRSLRFPRDPVPALSSDVGLSRRAARVVAEALGRAAVMEVKGSVPFNSEDFALFAQRGPAAMLLLGVANRDLGIRGIPHEPDFSVDEVAIRSGVHAMACVVWDALTALAADPRCLQAAR